MKKVNDDLKEDIKACIADKKNPGKCIDKALEEHGFDKDDKADVLAKVVKTE